MSLVNWLGKDLAQAKKKSMPKIHAPTCQIPDSREKKRKTLDSDTDFVSLTKKV